MSHTIATFAAHLRALITARAVQMLLPLDRGAADRYTRQDATFRREFPGIHWYSGRLDAIVNEHAAVWASTGRTGAIRRAKRDASERRSRDSVLATMTPANDRSRVAS